MKRNKKDYDSSSDNFTINSQQGPRIKHVCRSASTVLGLNSSSDYASIGM